MTNTTRKTKGFRLLFLSFAFALILLLAYRTFMYTGKSEKVKTEVFRVTGGWGYKVFLGNRVYIDQPFIPGIEGRRPFPDKKSAENAANTVKTKILQGKLPVLTREDILNAGVDSVGN